MFAGYTPSFCDFNVWILWKNAIGATAQAQCHSHCGPQPISRPPETGRGSEEIPTIHMENHQWWIFHCPQRFPPMDIHPKFHRESERKEPDFMTFPLHLD
jgi:hypothetical protein